MSEQNKLTIESLRIKNWKGIEEFEGSIEGKNVYLIGGNGTGKTSFIGAVWSGLTGKGIPTQATTDGARKGFIEVDLGDFIARTKLTNNKPTVFELENKDYTNESDKFIKAPRSYLESRIGMLNFDIQKFFAKSDAEQVKYFCKEQGIDFSDLDADIEENEENRKFDKKELKKLEDALPYYKKEDAEKELVDVIKLSNKLTANSEVKSTYERIEKGVKEKEARKTEIVKLIAELEEELYGNDKAEGEEGYVKGIVKEISAGNDWLNVEENKPLPEEEVKKLNEELNSSNETNKTIEEAKEAKADEEKIKQLEANIEENNKNIEKSKEAKAKRMAEAIKVEGLEYDVKGERFLYNGLPFEAEQINTASQLVAGMKIAATMLKDLKILKVDASLIDKVEFDKVLEWSENEGIELFIELVDREGEGLKIVIDEN